MVTAGGSPGGDDSRARPWQFRWARFVAVVVAVGLIVALARITDPVVGEVAFGIVLLAVPIVYIVSEVRRGGRGDRDDVPPDPLSVPGYFVDPGSDAPSGTPGGEC